MVMRCAAHLRKKFARKSDPRDPPSSYRLHCLRFTFASKKTICETLADIQDMSTKHTTLSLIYILWLAIGSLHATYAIPPDPYDNHKTRFPFQAFDYREPYMRKEVVKDLIMDLLWPSFAANVRALSNRRARLRIMPRKRRMETRISQ